MLDGEFAGERPCDFLLTASLDGDHECWRICKGRSPIPFLPPLAFQSPPSTGVQGRMLDKRALGAPQARITFDRMGEGRPAKVSGYVVCTKKYILLLLLLPYFYSCLDIIFFIFFYA